MLNCLGASIPPRERVVTCEEVFELKIPLRDCVGMQCRQPNLEGTGEIPLRRLVKEALRMRPSRLVVGEVRQEECLDLLIALGTITVQAARFLEAAVASGLNILVSGGTQAGKTTLLNCLCAAIPARERVITCEEVFELRVPLPDVVSMQTRQPNLEGAGEIPLRRLVKEALRMRPSRIVVGEVRQEECLDLLIALNSGLPGMCTLHANSAREAVTKICTLPLLAGENIGHAFVVPTVAASVDLVVHVGSDSDGRRRVREVVAVPGRAEDGVIELADVFTTRDGRLVRGTGYPPHPQRFAAHGFDLAALLDDARWGA